MDLVSYTTLVVVAEFRLSRSGYLLLISDVCRGHGTEKRYSMCLVFAVVVWLVCVFCFKRQIDQVAWESLEL